MNFISLLEEIGRLLDKATKELGNFHKVLIHDAGGKLSIENSNLVLFSFSVRSV